MQSASKPTWTPISFSWPSVIHISQAFGLPELIDEDPFDLHHDDSLDILVRDC